MNNSIILLDPFRSALVYQGVEEKILQKPRTYDFSDSIPFRIGRDPELRKLVLQLCVLYPEIKVIHHENDSQLADALKRGLDVMSLAPLQALGILSFSDLIDQEHVDKFAKSRPSTVRELYFKEQELLEPYEELIIPQLIAKEIIDHADFYWFHKSQRLKEDKGTFNEFDMCIFSALNELRQTELEKKLNPCDVGHFNINHTFDSTPKHAGAIYKIVLKELAQGKILFPTPTSLNDVIALRNDPEVSEFRKIFRQWMENIYTLNADEEQRMRREVKKFVFKSKSHYVLSSISEIVGYVSIPAGFIMDNVAGTLISLGTLGLDKLADRWQGETRWMSLGADTGRRKK